ncbi:MAG TPA: class I SAM-dependent methyltransferase [Chthonomonadaceae bacterium]|nr:class I SAM-dependent methyltransferase [Chthonomonadaceae bacterium]
MNKPPLVTDAVLERSEVVANNAMNRVRGISGPNSYAKDLGFGPLAFLVERLGVQPRVAWLDLCCGTGRALVQAASALRPYAGRFGITGVDLVPMFDVPPTGLSGIMLVTAAVGTWEPHAQFDLITCVHGLHYVGDKLGLLCRAAGWLKPDGRLLAHLDLGNLRVVGDERRRHAWRAALQRAGFAYSSHRRLVTCTGPVAAAVPYRYVGADAQAGPNCTGQAAVDSWYVTAD